MSFQKQERRIQSESTQLPDTLESQEESIPRALVPWSRDDDRSRYLGLRSSGFTIREALGLIGKAKSTLSAWRHDQKFLELEDSLPELRKTLGMEYAAMEFMRNYRLVLEKDYRIVKASLVPKKTKKDGDGNVTELPMDAQDFKYLLQMRSHYTPQQLQAIEQLFGSASSGGKEVNWTDYVLTMSRKTETEEVKLMPKDSRQRQEPELSRIVEAE